MNTARAVALEHFDRCTAPHIASTFRPEEDATHGDQCGDGFIVRWMNGTSEEILETDVVEACD